MKLSIFTDETGLDITEAIPLIKSWGLKYVDLRGRLFQRPLDKLTDEQMESIKKMLDENGMEVACIQSSLAKVNLPEKDRWEEEMHKLDRLIRASEIFNCKLIRSFFFWQVPKGHEQSGIGDLAIRPDVQSEVMEAFLPLAEKARKAGIIFAFENCGCTKEECFKMLELLNVPGWGFAWDPKNSWMHDQAERKKDLNAYMKKLASHTNCVHVKSIGSIWFPDGFERVPYEEIFKVLTDAGFDGPVSLEVHNNNPDISQAEACQQVLDVVRKAWPAAAAGAQTECSSLNAETVVRSYADNPVRFGVVGLGMGHNRACEMVKTPGIKLVQVCDLLEERRKRTAEACHVPATADYDELLKNPEIEAVMILNETGRHCELAERALLAGKNVLLTKPMDMNVEACKKLIALAKEKNLLLGLDHCRRLRPSVQSLKAAKEAGFFGRPLSLSVTLKIKRTMEYFQANGGWRGTRKLDGGVLSNQTIHHLDEILFLFGLPEEVRCDAWTQTHDIEMEDLGLAVWKYADGLVVNICATTNYPQASWYYQMEMHGTEGAYIHREAGPLSEPESLYFKDNAWQSRAPFPKECEWLNSMDSFASAMRLGTPLLTTAEEGLNAVRMIHAMYESAYDRQGAWVKVRE